MAILEQDGGGEIIGGKKAKPHSRPYMAYLEIRPGDKRFLCGGFLVAENFVLTAAHCNGEDTCNNDIMLLQLAHQARLSDQVQLIPLPCYGNKVIPGSVCSVAGWGHMSVSPGNTSDVLMEVVLEVMEDKVCSRHFNNQYKPGTMLCAGDQRGRKSSFQGDSGGPLVCGRVAQGIVSFGPNDASPPEVYTRVSQFIPWIKATIGKLQTWDLLEFSLHA
ncbi:mast cell protease 3-like [Chrysemys picta bellii]|uniref:mast cell protease 3-like n=1 Tax=Chrysemys picta bellii TaxID=8478 RepID=UPI0032B1A6BC